LNFDVTFPHGTDQSLVVAIGTEARRTVVSNLSTVTAENFREEVLQSPVPVVVDFAARWCGPCRAMAQSLENLAQEYAGQVRFFKVDIDDDPRLAEQLQITAVPTLLVFHGGKLVDRMVGMRSAGAIKGKLNSR
jgi:thioredoxin